MIRKSQKAQRSSKIHIEKSKFKSSAISAHHLEINQKLIEICAFSPRPLEGEAPRKKKARRGKDSRESSLACLNRWNTTWMWGPQLVIYNPYIPHIGIFFRICGTTGGITWYNPFTKWESSPSNTWPAVGNLNKSDEIMMTSIES